MTTISEYLLTRMQQAGVRQAFGVPGDYVLDFMDRVVASPIELVCTCNELNAGYAADACGRLAGIGAAVVTYGVGGMSILNAVAGACAERVPMIVISGAPHSQMRRSGMLMHHLATDYTLQRDVFEKITAASLMLTDPATAPDQIDRAMAACVAQKRPVYIEIPSDMVDRTCHDPGPAEPVSPPASDPGPLAEAVAEAAELLTAAQSPTLLVGVEVRRFGVAGLVGELLEKTGWPFAATINSKSTITESHLHYLGVYQGGFSEGPAHDTVEAADCLLTLGAWMTDITTGGFTAHLDDARMIAVNSDQVRIGYHVFPQVTLRDFVVALTAVVAEAPVAAHAHSPEPYVRAARFAPEPDRPLSVQRFFEAIADWLDDDAVVISDIGDMIFGATELCRPQPDSFIAQGYYMSIGYSLPAALGAAYARPDQRPVVFVGDGALQMTAQAIGTLIRYGKAPVAIVLNNDGYVIERMIHDGPYNELQMWHYSRLPDVFAAEGTGGIGCVARTEGQLCAALQTASDNVDRLVVIEVQVPRTDCTDVLARVGRSIRELSQEH
ncbi:MAG: alpha-keto acid decarboxylase family protein [Planctomycetota bacterium]|jgi:indolepyruvate decarboxylase